MLFEWLKKSNRNRAITTILVLTSLTACVLVAEAQAQSMDEDLVKAVYSYKFGKFTDWPDAALAEANKTLNFCILGKSPFRQEALDAIEGKAVKRKLLLVEHYATGLLSAEAVNNCRILFISSSERNRLASILKELNRIPILTISDMVDFSQMGGMITLVKIDNRIRFEINSEALGRAGLKISSKLLELAEVVENKTHGDSR